MTNHRAVLVYPQSEMNLHAGWLPWCFEKGIGKDLNRLEPDLIIDWIEFGQVSAERDENLSSYFFENGVLEAVVQNRFRFLVLGRKGAGKTAVFQHLDENTTKYLQPADFSENLSLQNYSWDTHKLLATQGKASSLAYIQSWKYIIYLLAVKVLIRDGVSNKKLASAGKLIGRLYKTPSPSLSEILGQKLLSLSKLKLPTADASLQLVGETNLSVEAGEVSFDELKSNSELKASLNNSIERLTDIFEEALLESLGDERRFFVAFDRIDEAWDAASFESSQRIIAGLLGASEFINQKFRGSLRPVIFLREDIFETIDINDRNKLRSDCGELLAWTKDGLARMILERVNFFAREAGQSEFSKIEDLFDREQMRQRRAPFDHIMLRTMLRPRDFIKFFQLIKSDMRDRARNPFEVEEVCSNALECQSIYNAEAAYSEWLVDELKDEWRVQFPMIGKLFAALQHNNRTNFTKEEFAASLRHVGEDAASLDIGRYLRFLFDNSIIGFRVGRSNQWRYKCFFPSQGYADADTFKIHDGLHRGLNLTESRAG